MELLESSYLPSNLNLQHKHIKKNTYFENWATGKQSPHKKRGHTVELKFNLHRHLVCRCCLSLQIWYKPFDLYQS